MTGAGLRRLLHAASAAILLVIPLASWTVFRLLMLLIVVAAVTSEVVRLRVPAWQDALARRVPVFRAHEARRPSGAMWLAIGYALASWCPAPAAVAGILVSALADPAGALIGSAAGTTAKTWRGTAAVLLVAGLVLWSVGFPRSAVVAGALVASVLERWPGPFDDNLVLAPGVAGTVWIVGIVVLDSPALAAAT